MFCYKCGQKLPDDAKFCMKCGTATLTNVPAQAPEETAQLESEVTIKQKKNTYNKIELILNKNIEKGTITKDWAEKLKGVVSDNLDTFQTMKELADFVSELSNRWEFFTPEALCLLAFDFETSDQFHDYIAHKLVDNILTGAEEPSTQPHSNNPPQNIKPLDAQIDVSMYQSSDVAAYMEIVGKDMVNAANQEKWTNLDLDKAINIIEKIIECTAEFHTTMSEENRTPFIVKHPANKAEVLSRLRIAGIYSPVLNEVYEKHKDDKFDEEETPVGHRINQLLLLEAQAKNCGITQEILGEAEKVYQLCAEELGDNKEPLKQHPLLRCLSAYHAVFSVLLELGRRYEEDRKKRRSSFFRKPQKLVFSDYKLLGEKGLWGLVDHLRLENVRVKDFGMLEYIHLFTFFRAEVLEEIFATILAEGEDPKAYKETLAGVKKHMNFFKSDFVSEVLEREISKHNKSKK